MTKWFVRRESDNRMLCVDGKWRNMVSADCIKLYSSAGRAIRYGLWGLIRGKVYAVYEGESIGADGKIYDVNDNLRLDTSGPSGGSGHLTSPERPPNELKAACNL